MFTFKQIGVLLIVGMLPISANCTSRENGTGIEYSRQHNIITEYRRIQHLDIEEIMEFIQINMLSNKGNVFMDKRINTLVISDTYYQIKIIENFIEKVDKPLSTE